MIDLRHAMNEGLEELRAEIGDLLESLDKRTKPTTPAFLLRVQVDDLEGADLTMYQALSEWRLQTSKAQGFDAYRVFSNRILAEIVRVKPDTLFAMSGIKGIGQIKTKEYGDAVLAIVEKAGRTSW